MQSTHPELLVHALSQTHLSQPTLHRTTSILPPDESSYLHPSNQIQPCTCADPHKFDQGDEAVLLAALASQFPDCPNPTFKSPAQHEMCMLSVTQEINFIAVLLTGGGKSLSWMLPTCIENDSLTLVVILNCALLQDQLRRASELRIKACQWMSQMDTLPDGV